MLICIYNLTDDETFNLWDTSNLILVTFTGYSNLLIISDRLCFIGFNILYISAIGISVKSHIGASLILYNLYFQLIAKFMKILSLKFLTFILCDWFLYIQHLILNLLKYLLGSPYLVIE